jgi:hypothetical protein
MKLRILVVAAISFGLTCAALAADYSALAQQGYRWVTVDGPYACPSQADVRRITGHRTDATELQMVDNLQAYYLITGTLVQVVQDDPATGMSQIRVAGITKGLWTETKFLSKRPIQDPYGIIETPENSGLIPTDTTGMSQLPEQPGAMPVPSVSPSPSASPMLHTKPGMISGQGTQQK